MSAYPPLEPYRTGRLRVSDVHELYFEESGDPAGRPVVVLHGGPGFGSDASDRRLFDPARYRIVLYDQRGAGRSTPAGSLVDNTTPHLVGDLEKLRAHLAIDRWQVFGGSWGATLALAYAEAHPTRVLELVLRGVFLGTKAELDWLYRGGIAALQPEAWARFTGSVKGDPIAAYHALVHGGDVEAARAWCEWEARLCTLVPDEALIARIGAHPTLAQLETHYFARGPWVGDLLAGIDAVRHLPCVIVHGRLDLVCPVRSALRLHEVWPEAELHVVEGAGHSQWEPGILACLVTVTDRFARRR